MATFTQAVELVRWVESKGIRAGLPPQQSPRPADPHATVHALEEGASGPAVCGRPTTSLRKPWPPASRACPECEAALRDLGSR